MTLSQKIHVTLTLARFMWEAHVTQNSGVLMFGVASRLRDARRA
jgi:hypothetical protein